MNVESQFYKYRPLVTGVLLLLFFSFGFLAIVSIVIDSNSTPFSLNNPSNQLEDDNFESVEIVNGEVDKERVIQKVETFKISLANKPIVTERDDYIKYTYLLELKGPEAPETIIYKFEDKTCESLNINSGRLYYDDRGMEGEINIEDEVTEIKIQPMKKYLEDYNNFTQENVELLDKNGNVVYSGVASVPVCSTLSSLEKIDNNIKFEVEGPNLEEVDDGYVFTYKYVLNDSAVDILSTDGFKQSIDYNVCESIEKAFALNWKPNEVKKIMTFELTLAEDDIVNGSLVEAIEYSIINNSDNKASFKGVLNVPQCD